MNKSTFLPSIIFILLAISSSVMAQTGVIRGFVYEEETGEPVIFTNVYLARSTYGAATDVNGYFVISAIPPGDYTLMVTYLGYDTLQMPVTVVAGDIISKQLYLSKASYMLDEVNISAVKEEARTETRVSVIKLTPKQIKQIPSVGGQPDLAQYLQVLPGIIYTGDQGGQLYIRGGSPIQNKIIMDGMVVYNPFHSIGMFSVFETDIIRNTEVYTGGFNAEHGGRISSVIDVTYRDGNKKRFSGKVGASTYASEFLIEGPIKKQKQDGTGSSSFILSARHSYLDQSSKIFYDYVDSTGLPFRFTDIYGKISLNASNGSKISFFGFHFDDQVNDYQSLADYNWKSSGGGMNFVVIPGKSPALLEGFVSYSDYGISLEEEVSPPRTSDINRFSLGLTFTYFFGKDLLKYGLEILALQTNYQFYSSLNTPVPYKESTTEFIGFIKYKKVLGKLLVEPGFRLQWYGRLGVSPEPRLAVKYNATDRLRFKLAGGLYSQNLVSARSERDIVNLFYGFLSDIELQKAQHAIIGAEYDLGNYITLNVEGYYKNFSQLTNINRNKIYDNSPTNANIPDELKKDFVSETGNSQGVDITFKYEHNRIYFWAVYSLGKVQLDDGETEYYPHFDRRHNVNLVATYLLGGTKTWEISARWNLGSGFPFTQTQGFFEKITFNNGINSNYTSQNGQLGIIYAELNSGRLPYYHRLDVNIKKTIEFSRFTKLEINAGATNVYDRDNIFYIDRITNKRVDQLPVMPSMGLKFSF